MSPADVRHGRFKGALGDCFQSGLRPSQEILNPTASGSAVATPTIRHVLAFDNKSHLSDFIFKEIKMAEKRHGRGNGL